MKKLPILLFVIIASMSIIFNSCIKDDTTFFQEEEIPALKSATVQFSPEVEAAIVTGIDWLLTTQSPDGIFGGASYDPVANTALAVTKLCDRSRELNSAPLSGPYALQIEKGLNYIFDNAISNPEGGIYLSTSVNHSVYNTGIAMMAIASANCPNCIVEVSNPLVDGLTFLDVLKLNIDFFIAAQNPDGGWRYFDHTQLSDNSNTGFAVLGLLAAESVGIEIPKSLKDNLSIYIDFIQNDVTGGSGYVNPGDWENILKAGNLLFEMAFVGDDPNTARVLHAIDYIENHWNDPNLDPGWRPNNFLAMYCLMKGFVSLKIENINVDETPVNWYDEFVTAILAQPHWPLPQAFWTSSFQSSIFGLLTLEKFTPVPVTVVPFDVFPVTCPNEFNREGKGWTPMALLGTTDFDVTQVNIETLLIEGVVAPVKWSLEDVGTPQIPFDASECNMLESDGFMDLTLKFKSVEIGPLFAGAEPGDVIVATITGELLDGTPIIGTDALLIVK